MNESEFLKETEERLKWCRHLENHFHKAADSLPGYVLIRRNIRLLDSVLKEYRDISKAYDAYFPDEWKAPAPSKAQNASPSAQTASDAAGHPEDLRKTTAHKRRRWKVEDGLP